ncbi:MAG TPA: TonB family protein [Paludibacter sp.]|nr:TonB family protein [Paludibacter sp.]
MTYSINDQPPARGHNKASMYGFIGSFLSCLVLFLLTWFYIMPFSTIVQPVEEEGLLISFGNNEHGGGQGEELMGRPDNPPVTSRKEEAAKPVAVSKPVAATTSTRPKTSADDYVTQQEASLAIAEKRKKEQERAEQQAIENERIAKEKQIADRKRRETEAISKANASMNGLFGNSNSAGNGKGTGTGSEEGPGHQGNPAGKGYSGGHSWSLSGRSLTSLVQPAYDNNTEGKITVNIRVDQDGRVTSTSIGSPTTISDAKMREDAFSAARRARFSGGSGTASGSITYNFRLR